MASGKLRHPIEIQEYTETKNAFGEEVRVWVTYAAVWAEVKPVKADEYFASQKNNHMVTHRVITRFIDGVKPNMRIVRDSRVFEIVGVRNFFEKDAFLELMCEEVYNG